MGFVRCFLLLAAWPWIAFAQHAPAAALDAEARQIQLAPGLKLQVWAAEPQLLNPVAFSLVPVPPVSPEAEPGTAAYIAETHRYGISVLDITQNTAWLLNDLSFRTVADRTRFLLSQFVTNASLLTQDSEKVRVVVDTDGDHRADDSSLFSDGFQSVADGTAAGVLAHGTDVWFGNIPHLWRLSRTPASEGLASHANGRAQSRRSIASGFGVHIGVTGHDLHGLVLGPDGRLYMSFGDRGLAVTNAHGASIQLPDTGGVLRCEPDGTQLEVFCTGLRNPQELAFDDFGNLFTVDNDTAGADDCRVLHLVEGADYGWRASYQHMKGFGPWVQEELWKGGQDGILPPAGQVSQGPAGLTYYPGTGFGDRFAHQFLHCDFPGGVWAFNLVPQGASFRVGTREKVAWNCWPTDVEFGPDGALYLLDWVAGWGMPKKGRIYRITDTQAVDPTTSREVHRGLAQNPASQSEAALHDQLTHRDRRMRLEAQWELARRGRSSFGGLQRIAFSAAETRPRLHALWGIGQIVRGAPPGSSQGELRGPVEGLIRLLGDPDAEVRATAAMVLGEAGTMAADLPIAALTADANAKVRFAAANALLARFSNDRGVESTTLRPDGETILSLVRSNRTGDPWIRHAAARYWAGQVTAKASGSTHRQPSAFLTQQISDPSREVRHTTLLALRNLGSAEIDRFLSDEDPELLALAVRAIHDVPIPSALPSLAGILETASWIADKPDPTNRAGQRVPTNPLVRRTLHAHFRLGQESNALALAGFATRTNTAAALRAEALFLLGAWEVAEASPGRVPLFPKPDPNHGAVPSINPENWPGWFDRVVGLWRPLPPRSADAARAAVTAVVETLLRDPSPIVGEAALEAAVRLRIPQAAPILLGLQQSGTPVAWRRRIPEALAALRAPETEAAVRRALEDSDPNTRAAALPYLDRLGGDSATPILTGLIQAGTLQRDSESIRMAQAALLALGRLSNPESAQTALTAAFDAFFNGRFPPELEADLIHAAQLRTNASLTALMERRAASLPADDPLAAWREVLVGGDAAQGRSLFFDKPETQCSRCHKVGTDGGGVGPALDGLATRMDRRQILDSILHPNAQIAAGFDNVLLVLQDGTEVAGRVLSENPTELIVITGEDGEQKVAVPSIAERRRTLSAMPEGLADLLTRRELRDLIEYLASLR
jgi:quinoprotein glucose dehydrogenase